MAKPKRAHCFSYRFQVAPKYADPRRLIEYLPVNFQKKYGATPAPFFGTLKQKMNEAFPPDSTVNVSLALC